MRPSVVVPRPARPKHCEYTPKFSPFSSRFPPAFFPLFSRFPPCSIHYIALKKQTQIQSQKLNKRTKLKMALDAAQGMTHLHSKGIVHRDLKTLNLLVTDDFVVKVADFGLAKVKSIAKSVMTGSIHVMGTLAYMVRC
jgi:serine/threonine protein kinase